MGNFNPNLPAILGMEFVPLADGVRELDIGSEIGYSFTVTGAPNNALSAVIPRPFVPASAVAGQTVFYNIYPYGREDDVGEINVLRLTVATAFVTGAVVSGSSAATALTEPSDASFIEFDALADRLRVTFNAPFALTGKRILGVDLVYQAAGNTGFALEPSIESNTVRYPYGPYMTGPPSLAQISNESTVRFGDVNPWWSTSGGPDTLSERQPWRYTDMLRWLTGAGGQLYIGVRPSTIPLSGFARLGYLAVDVYYCEESRVAYGGVALGQDPNGLLSFTSTYSFSPNMRDSSQATPVTLTPGDYTVTVGMADAGDKYNAGDAYSLPELFQFAPVATHPTVQVTKFKRPAAGRPIIAPVSAPTDFMVAAGLNASGTALQTGEASVPYITAEGAPVYLTTAGTSITATQQIHNEASPARPTYEQVRFYARRFNPLAPGDLTVTVSGSGSATITPAQFALLDELMIGDNGPGTGWREVTLPISATFLSDGTFRNVVFSMTGVATSQPVDQWQVLTSRVFTYNSTEGRSPHNNTPQPLYEKSRYDGLQNGTMTWKSPEGGGGLVTDSDSTAVVMFSQDPAAPTGMGISQFTQPVSGIALSCASLPKCIPTGISYNHIGWSPGLVVCDSFGLQVAAGGWGNAFETNQAWAVTSPAADFYVSGGYGVQANAATGVIHRASINGPIINSYAQAFDFGPGVVATGGTISMRIQARRDAGANNEYFAELLFGLSGALTLGISKRVGGVVTALGSYTMPNYAASSRYNMTFFVEDTLLRAKAWLVGTPEPLSYQLSVTDSAITAAGTIGLSTFLAAGNTNTLPVVLTFGGFMSNPLDMINGTYELQRMDDVDDEWQTIALTSICVTGISDYEARVGVLSSYRIRTCNSSGFCGPWSSTITSTLTSPGVSGAGDGNSVLIFTSNLGPTGNLAYVMTWDGDVVEDFTFPEAGFGQVRTRYQEDFFTVFHGTERGGEAFSRQILVNAAAIPPESLANFKGLRDLGWADLPYVCVRDELGNRWFANVRVPTGTVKRNRRLYMANVDVLEVTNTPAPVT